MQNPTTEGFTLIDLDSVALPSRALVGIQGGTGSFNDLALQCFLHTQPGLQVEPLYLYKSAAVVEALFDGRVNLGQMAISNTVGGSVAESVAALAGRSIKIVGRYSLAIEHCLMGLKTSSKEEMAEIVGHEQAIMQCSKWLNERGSGLLITPGDGDAADPAYLADRLVNGALPRTTAVIGSQALAAKFDLKIFESAIQDRTDNTTTFILFRQ